MQDCEFQDWLAEVDTEIGKICGLSHNDLPDQCWYDWFDSGMEPEKAARECLELENFPEFEEIEE